MKFEVHEKCLRDLRANVMDADMARPADANMVKCMVVDFIDEVTGERGDQP